LILNTFLLRVIILIANILKRAFSSQIAAKLRNRLLVLRKPFFVPFGAVVYSVINIKLGEHIVALCQFIHRSEERFSRNAETDLVCRLLLEKKKTSHRSIRETRKVHSVDVGSTIAPREASSR